MLDMFKSQINRYLRDDGRHDIDFKPHQARLSGAHNRLLVATDEFNKALGDLRDELLLYGRNLN